MIKNKRLKNLSRKSLQWIILLLLGYMVVRLFVEPNYIADFEAYCPFGGLQAFTSFFVNNSLACSMAETQIFMGVLMAAGILIFSKLFCSFICPIGTVTEWLAKLGARFKVLITLNGLSDKLLRILKYALLFATFYFTVTSSELFCKEYDPFYAVFTGFGHDVYLWFALPALLLTIVGSIFIRQFWCKYLCPLGALSNIFSNGVMVAGVVGIYFLLRWFGVELSWIWPAAVISVLGFILESWRLKGWIFPAFKITRNEQKCTDCGFCDLSCPMGLDIATVKTVEHIDCHLCGECLTACPINDTLTINKRNMPWMPAAATVLLIAVGLYLATTIELPTINLRWGKENKLAKAAVFSQSGLKNVKCYGSSMSFASQMRRVKGVLGVETYVKSHTVKILYDSTMLNARMLKQKIFSPARTLLRKPPKNAPGVATIRMKIDKLFDSYDNFYLTQLLKQTDGIWGFSTEFGEPVLAQIYFDSAKVSPADIKRAVEQPELTYVSRGKAHTVGVNFKVNSMDDSLGVLPVKDFISRMFAPYNMAFNHYKSYKPEELAVYELPMPQAASPRFRRSLQMLVSHLSTDDNVVRFQTVYTDKPYARIYYVTGKISPDSIYAALQKPTLTVHYRNGKTGKVKNPFKFPVPGKTLTVKE